MLKFDKPKDIAKEICTLQGVNMSNDNLKRLADILEPIKLIRGKKPVQEGEVCKNIFYVKHGLLVQTYKKNGVKVTESFAHEGDFAVSIESYFRQEPSQLEIQTLEPSILYGIPYDKLMELAHSSFEICNLFFAIERNMLYILQQRADAMRFESAKDKYLRLTKTKPEIVRRAPMHLIASFLQITSETLSRVRTQVNSEEK